MSRFFLIVAVLAASAPAPDVKQAAEKEQLARFQQLVGSWRGVGQPQRGSTKDSWVEEADWAWNFGQDGPALVAKQPQGKYFRELRLAASEAGQYSLQAKTAGGETARYV